MRLIRRLICRLKGHRWRDHVAFVGLMPGFCPTYRRCDRCRRVA